MAFTLTFLQALYWAIVFFAPLLGGMLVIIVLAGLIVSRVEKWPKFDAIYWAFITATTVGYGDIRPKSKPARVFSILISVVGLMLSGILIALVVESARVAFELHIPQEQLDKLKERIEG